jgi:hypothetical protein
VSTDARELTAGGWLGRLWPILGGLVAASHAAGLLVLGRWLDADAGRGLRLQLALWLLSGGLWLALLGALRMTADWSRVRERRALLFFAVLGLFMRLPALALPVVHLTDVYRYLWDGQVQLAGLDPYAGSPEAPLYEPLRSTSAAGELFARINHRHLPTIYPPVAQAAFALSARLSSGLPLQAAVRRWKVLCGALELLLWGALLLLYQKRPSASSNDPPVDRPWLAAWVLCPLPAVEIWLNGHLDGLGILFLVVALLGLRHAGRAAAAAFSGAALLLSTFVKPLGLVLLAGVLPDKSLRRRFLVWFCAGALCAGLSAWWPYRPAGVRVAPSLGEYGRRWRSNDGAYAILHGAVEAAVSVAYRPPYYTSWRVKSLARLISGRDRDTVWPDELASFLSRLLAAGALGLLLLYGIRRKLAPERISLLLLSGYALLTPTLHPWYLLWPLGLCPLWPRAAPPMLALAALSPLAYVGLPAEWAGSPHSEPVWARLIEHGTVWLLCAWGLASDAARRRNVLFSGAHSE